jgi:hypothetical protein
VLTGLRLASNLAALATAFYLFGLRRLFLAAGSAFCGDSVPQQPANSAVLTAANQAEGVHDD